MATARQKKEKRLTKEGREKLNPKPMAPQIGYKKQQSIADRVRDMVRSERLKMEAEMAGAEPFEEADDFDIPEDRVEPPTPYGMVDLEGGGGGGFPASRQTPTPPKGVATPPTPTDPKPEDDPPKTDFSTRMRNFLASATKEDVDKLLKEEKPVKK